MFTMALFILLILDFYFNKAVKKGGQKKNGACPDDHQGKKKEKLSTEQI